MKEQPKKQWKDLTGKEKILGSSLSIGLLVAVIFLGVSIFGGGAKQRPSYKASVANYGSVDPATIRAYINVKNTGDVAGRPACTVSASSDDNRYHGVAILSPAQELQAGKEVVFNGTVTIENEGSSSITSVVVECE